MIFLINSILILGISVGLFYKLKKLYLSFDSLFKNALLALVFVHFSMFAFHWYWSLEHGVDVKNYYNSAKECIRWLDYFHTGSPFVIFLIVPLVKAKLFFFTLFFIFSALSFLGFLKYITFLFDHNKQLKKRIVYCAIAFILIPSFHFWTGSISKEALLFYLLTIVLFQLEKREKLIHYKFILPALLILAIRPYLFFILIASIFLSFILSNTYSTKQKTIALITSLFLAVITLPLLLDFLSLDNFNDFYANVYEKINNVATNNGSSVSLQSSTYLERVLYVLVQPFFYNASTFYKLVISFENSFIILILFFFLKGSSKQLSNVAIYAFSFAALTILFYSAYMYNLGLASRMRIMFYPYILYGFISIQKRK